MNEGEKKVIEILTDYKNRILERKPFTYSFVDMQWAINSILDLYNKEKEKNKQLNRLKGFEMLDIFNMGKESSRQRIKCDWVEKEKIQEKIEELFEEMEELDSLDEDDNEEKRTLTDIIVILKELLEEKDE